MAAEYSNRILLTGAGFTKNFGGFLADEMWARIFNHPEVQALSVLRNYLLHNFDYESVYQDLIYGTHWEHFTNEKAAIKEAVFAAYKELDDGIVKDNDMEVMKQQAGRFNAFRPFLKRFADPTPNRKTWRMIFTLNQDLYIERWSDTLYVCPGVIQRPIFGNTTDRATPYEDKFNVTLPESPSVTLDDKALNYIKLHGSFNWLRHDGDNVMVIGGGKEEKINREPLLKEYFDIFKAALSQDGAKLFVIGYGFRDPHINDVIANAIENHGLKHHVLSPESPKSFITDLREKGDIGEIILFSGLAAYHHGDLSSVDLKKVGDNFFG